MKRLTIVTLVILTSLALETNAAATIKECDEWLTKCQGNSPLSYPHIAGMIAAISEYGECIMGPPPSAKSDTTHDTKPLCQDKVDHITKQWGYARQGCIDCISDQSPYKDCPGFAERVSTTYVCLPALK